MKTTVVNVKREPCDVLMDRTTEFGNPFRIGVFGNRARVIELFRGYLRTDLLLQHKLKQHRGKRIGCHCKPLPCHLDVVAEFLDTGTI